MCLPIVFVPKVVNSWRELFNVEIKCAPHMQLVQRFQWRDHPTRTVFGIKGYRAHACALCTSQVPHTLNIRVQRSLERMHIESEKGELAH